LRTVNDPAELAERLFGAQAGPMSLRNPSVAPMPTMDISALPA
jgi:hypothetical protein